MYQRPKVTILDTKISTEKVAKYKRGALAAAAAARLTLRTLQPINAATQSRFFYGNVPPTDIFQIPQLSF